MYGCTAPHDLLLDGVLGDEAVDVDDARLTDAVRSVHGLQVLLRIPVVLDKYDRVGAGQVETEAAHLGREQQHVYAGIRVEALHDAEAFARRHAAVQSQVAHVVHLAQQLALDQVDH